MEEQKRKKETKKKKVRAKVERGKGAYEEEEGDLKKRTYE